MCRWKSGRPAHTQSLSEVLPTIQATLMRQKAAAAQENFAQALTSEAIKNGLEKTAEAHHLQVVTTPPTAEQGMIAALPDSAQLLGKAFQAKKGDPAAVCADGRRLCGLPGDRHYAGARADLCRLEEPRAG